MFFYRSLICIKQPMLVYNFVFLCVHLSVLHLFSCLFVLAAIMEVHEDFFVYNSGIYKHTDVSFTKPPQYRKHGTHSVRITG